jgi:DtxR family Mn-dependent transcriptional regulator
MTPEGAALAEGVVRKHRLAERLLVDVIGLEWEKAHLEAGRWEHVISDDVERRLVELLGNPTTCPHGNPIPGAEDPGADRRRLQRRLADMAAGDQVRLERITESVEHDAASLHYLSHHALTPGVTATVRDKAPDGTMTLVVEGAAVAVGPAISRQLFVTVP